MTTSAWKTFDDQTAAQQTDDRPRRPEPIVLPRCGSVAVASPGGFVTLSTEGSSVRVQCGEHNGSVLLAVVDAIELHDGDMISAGHQWMRYDMGRQGRPNRLHRLDNQGQITMTFGLRNSSTIVGRSAGDIVLPLDLRLGELHFQVLCRDDRVYLQDMATEDGTYLLVRPGELLPSGSRLLVGDRLIEVNAPLANPDEDEATWTANVNEQTGAGWPQWPDPWLEAANTPTEAEVEVTRACGTLDYGQG